MSYRDDYINTNRTRSEHVVMKSGLTTHQPTGQLISSFAKNVNIVSYCCFVSLIAMLFSLFIVTPVLLASIDSILSAYGFPLPADFSPGIFEPAGVMFQIVNAIITVPTAYLSFRVFKNLRDL